MRKADMNGHKRNAAEALQDRRLTIPRAILWGCTIAVAIAIFAFSAQEGTESSAVSNRVADLVIALIDPDFDALPAAEQASIFAFVKKLVRKAAHFSEFALLGFCLRQLTGSYGVRRPTRRAWLAGTLYACTDEVHQLFVASRAGMWQDVLLDSSGVLAGVAAAYAARVLWGRYQHWRQSDK